MTKIFALLFLSALLCQIANGSTSPDQDYTALLKDHVQNGVVDYAELCKDPRLSGYIKSIAASNALTAEEEDVRLSYWINAYNAFTLLAICEKYPIKSINELSSPDQSIWDHNFIQIAGKKISLNHIEHSIIRKQFKEPRIHFALVCASKSCPPLRSEAFAGAELNNQLEDQGRIFFRDPSRNQFDLKTRTAKLSRVLEWYSKDFGNDKREVLAYTARFLPQDLASDIRANLQSWQISYLEYDWALNE